MLGFKFSSTMIIFIFGMLACLKYPDSAFPRMKIKMIGKISIIERRGILIAFSFKVYKKALTAALMDNLSFFIYGIAHHCKVELFHCGLFIRYGKYFTSILRQSFDNLFYKIF